MQVMVIFTIVEIDSEVYNIPKSKGKNSGEHQFVVEVGEGVGLGRKSES